MHEGEGGRPCAGNGRERPVAGGQQEMVERDVFARCDEGCDRSAWKPATQAGRRRAGAEWRVAEGFGGQVDAYVCRDRVDSAGGDDDRARFCRQIVKSKSFCCRVQKKWDGAGRINI